jgi:dTDP-4-dehydrorhamnose 3,5-epimerase
MKVSGRAKINDTIVFNSDKKLDHRGSVTTVPDLSKLSQIVGSSFPLNFVHETYSKKDVLRGIHYQLGAPQSRLLRVSYGTIYDVALDLRKSSPTFGKWQAEILTSENSCAIWLPSGVAHAYYVISDFAIVNGYSSCEYDLEAQRVIKWNDPILAIDWPFYSTYPVIIEPILSLRDLNGVEFSGADHFD